MTQGAQAFSIVVTGLFHKYAEDGSIAQVTQIPLRSKIRHVNHSQYRFLKFYIRRVLEELNGRSQELSLSSSNWALANLLEARVEIIDTLPTCTFGN